LHVEQLEAFDQVEQVDALVRHIEYLDAQQPPGLIEVDDTPILENIRPRHSVRWSTKIDIHRVSFRIVGRFHDSVSGATTVMTYSGSNRGCVILSLRPEAVRHHRFTVWRVRPGVSTWKFPRASSTS